MQFLLEDVKGHVGVSFGSGHWLHLRCRQGFLVDLLVLVERYAVYLHRDSRHHIRRLLVEDEVIERIDIDGLVADDIRCTELTSAFGIKRLHGDILDALELADDRLYLFEFDAEASYLHLTVTSSDEGQVSVRQIADDISGLVDTRVPGFGSKGVGDIYLFGLLRPVEISAAHLRSGNP